MMRIGKKKEAEMKCDPRYMCAVEVTLSVIGGKWKVMVLSRLHEGVTRFGQLRRAIPGITQTMLTQQLRELEDDGIVTRTIYPEIPPRVEYALTDFGKTLDCVINVMGQWGGTYYDMVIAKKRAARGLERGSEPDAGSMHSDGGRDEQDDAIEGEAGEGNAPGDSSVLDVSELPNAVRA